LVVTLRETNSLENGNGTDNPYGTDGTEPGEKGRGYWWVFWETSADT